MVFSSQNRRENKWKFQAFFVFGQEKLQAFEGILKTHAMKKTDSRVQSCRDERSWDGGWSTWVMAKQFQVVFGSHWVYQIQTMNIGHIDFGFLCL